jgi:proton-translocating NADH-quinone oxidoreductase chain N
LLFKVGAAPFHSWLCDVYDGSTLSVTFLFATAPKIILFSLFVKLFFFAFYNFQDILLPFFLFSAISSIAVGSFSAIYQKRIKRLFAYSTIAHSGFILLAVVAGSLDSAKSSIFYIFAYAFLTLLLFSILIYVTTAISNFPKYLVNWTSFGFKNPILAITFTFTLFSIAGIPPLLGFFSKFFVLFSVVAKDFYFTSFVVIVLSSIACFYYIRLIKIFYFTKTSKHNLWISNKSSKNAEWVISLLLFFNLTFFTKPELLSSFALVTSLSLF